MECPKCQYQRKATDNCPDWQCPSCGIAYNKFTNNSSGSNLGTGAISLAAIEQRETEVEFEPSSFVRRRGALALIFGLVMAVVFATILWKFFTGPGTILIPLFFVMVAAGGLVEFASGISMVRIAKSWNEFEKTRTAHIIKYTIYGVIILALIIVFFRARPT